MIATFSPSDAQIIVAAIGLVGAVLVAVIKRAETNQRGDHARTADMVREIRTDVSELKDDVRDIKADVRDHGDRLRGLEAVHTKQAEVDEIVARFPKRKAQ